MDANEKYEELRKYFEDAEKREQQYIVVITKLQMQVKELQKKLESA